MIKLKVVYLGVAEHVDLLINVCCVCLSWMCTQSVLCISAFSFVCAMTFWIVNGKSKNK